MSVTRREFIKSSSVAAAAFAALPYGESASDTSHIDATPQASRRELCVVALDAARSGGASYADVRVVENRQQHVAAQDGQITDLSDQQTVGIAVRALVGGVWGFAAGHEISRGSCQRVARQAVVQAGANLAVASSSVTLAPVNAYPDATFQTAVRQDPFDVPIEEKIELLQAANREALRVRGIRTVRSSLTFLRDEQAFASTDGSVIQQVLFKTLPSFEVTAMSTDSAERATRSSYEVPPMALGFEYIEDADLPTRAGEWAENAVEMLTAPQVEPGRYDLVLDPTHLWRTIYETIGQPAGLDRALGIGGPPSFLAPPQAVIGTLKLGPEFMNVQCDRTQHGALATIGWDDDGVPADSWAIIKDGTVVDYQTTREHAGRISDLTGFTRSHGCSVARSWNVMQSQQTPNVSLLPADPDRTLEELIAGTDRGIFVKGFGPHILDARRETLEFSGQEAFEVRNGRVAGRVQNVAYRARTAELWNALDQLGGPNSYVMGGLFLDDARGCCAVGLGCPPARFRNISVINRAA